MRLRENLSPAVMRHRSRSILAAAAISGRSIIPRCGGGRIPAPPRRRGSTRRPPKPSRAARTALPFAGAHSPIGRRAVVIVQSTLPIAVNLSGFVKTALADRRPAQLLAHQIELVGVEILVVAQHAPRQRAVFLADPEKTAEGHDRVSNPAAALVDHDALDRADPLAVAAPHRRTLDLVAGDQTRRFAHHNVGSNSGHCSLLHLTYCWINTWAAGRVASPL